MKILTLLLALTGMATAGTMKVDMDKSWLKIDCKATGHSWTAEVKKFSAVVSGDDSTLTPKSASLSWSFSDIDSAKADRDKKMLEWIDSGKFPKGSWKMTGQGKDANGELYVKGPLTIHGVSKEITMLVTAAKNGKIVILDGEAWIDTTDFTLPIIKMLVMTVNPKVKVRFHLEGQSN